jgi:hypothetical protein
MGAPLHCNTYVGGGEILENWDVGKAKWYCGFMVEATFQIWWELAVQFFW